MLPYQLDLIWHVAAEIELHWDLFQTKILNSTKLWCPGQPRQSMLFINTSSRRKVNSEYTLDKLTVTPKTPIQNWLSNLFNAKWNDGEWKVNLLFKKRKKLLLRKMLHITLSMHIFRHFHWKYKPVIIFTAHTNTHTNKCLLWKISSSHKSLLKH